MPDRALQMPFDESEATQVGRRTYRKQILPVGSLEYEGRTLNFTREYLEDLANNFNSGAFDQVPFQLADPENRHTNDPERFRGEVKALELADDGLYGIVELTDDGAEVVEKNPKLGVSARIIEGIKDGAGNAIQHVLGTLDPRVTGMGQWEAVNLSASDVGVVDLTAASYSQPVPATSTTQPRTDDAAARELLQQMLQDDDGDATTVQLSAEDRQTVELAEQRATAAERRVTELEARIDNEHFERQRRELLEAGVPPAMVDLAEPLLRGASGTIELSNGTRVNAGNVVEKMLAECRGMIDLTTVSAGSGAEGSEEAEARQMAQAWAGDNGGGTD
jgi:hypothetical protein